MQSRNDLTIGDKITDPNELSALNSESGLSSNSSILGEKITDSNELAILNAENNVKSMNESPISTRIGKDIAAGFLSLGQGLLNSPHNIAKYISPEIEKTLESKYPGVMKKTDIGIDKILSIKDPDWKDKLLQNAIQYAPFAEAGSALIPGKALLSRLGAASTGGASYGALQSENPVKGSIEGAISGPIGEVAGIGLGHGLIKPAANLMSNKLAPAIADLIKGKFHTGYENDISDSFKAASQNYRFHKNDEQEKWNMSNQHTAIADLLPNIKYDDSGRINALLEQRSKLQETPIKSQTAEQKAALKRINGLIETPIKSFTQALNYGKSLNESYGETMTPGVSPQFSSVNGAIKGFMKNMDNNINNPSNKEDLKRFGNAWKAARDSTIAKIKTFHEVPSDKGGTNDSKFVHFFKNTGKYSDPTTFISDYIPSKGEKGTGRMEQFSDVVGSPTLAKRVLLKSIFGEKPNMKNILDTYDKLSDQQKNFLFNQQDKQHLDFVNYMLDKNPKVLQDENVKHGIYGMIGKSILPGAIGAIAGGFINHPIAASIVGASIPLSSGVSGLLAKSATKIPFIKQEIINKELNNPKMISKIASYLSSKVPQSVIATQGVSQQPISFLEDNK
jgi:hypothetical protein